MPVIAVIDAGYYRIPLPVPLSDSTHGNMLAFELNTVRLRDADGAEGTGYTFTCGRNGAAIDAILRRDVPEQLIGQDADRIEHLWQRIWWGQHYGGRGGPAVLAQSALDMALWDLKARRLDEPLWRLLGGFDPRLSPTNRPPRNLSRASRRSSTSPSGRPSSTPAFPSPTHRQ